MQMRNLVLSASIAVLGASLGGCMADTTGLAQAEARRAPDEPKPGAHGDITCSQSGSTLVCEGDIWGLGSEAVVVSVDATRECINGGNNRPPGQVDGYSEPIDPENGHIEVYAEVDAGCPDTMDVDFIGTVHVEITTVGGALVFEADVPVT